MTKVDMFSHGALNPVFAFGLAFLGCGLALSCAARGRTVGAAHRRRWLTLAAMTLGGGIWLMHFMAMLGFDVPASPLRYDLGLTAVSAVLAGAVVFIGLFVAGTGRPRPLRIIFGGVFTGAGVSAMHYTGMAAVRVAGSLTYEANLVLASVLVAIVAAIVALWLSVVVRGRAQVLVAGGVMAVAVCSMHYTAMAAVRVHLDAGWHGPMRGVTPISLELPITLLASAAVIVLAFLALHTVSAEDRDAPVVRLVPRPLEPQRGRPLPRHADAGR